MPQNNTKHWIQAARPKTLALAIAGILLGSAISFLDNSFHLSVLLFGILTAILLQILSNFANDYGDFMKGTDIHAQRTDRMLAADKITPLQMKKALVITAIAAFISGLLLLNVAGFFMSTRFYIFLLLGLLAIAAAIKYTVGKFAYAYSGLGDIFVLVFFGFISVVGIYYLHAGSINLSVVLAALGCGLLSVGVLNINNTRDLENDEKSGKITIPVRLGLKKSLLYQRLLCWIGFLSLVISFIYRLWQDGGPVSTMVLVMIFGVFSPVILVISGHISRMKDLVSLRSQPIDSPMESEVLETEKIPSLRDRYNKELKTLSLSTLAAVLIYWILAFLYA